MNATEGRGDCKGREKRRANQPLDASFILLDDYQFPTENSYLVCGFHGMGLDLLQNNPTTSLYQVIFFFFSSRL